MKTGLVLEGGALRTIYSTGVMDAMLSKDLMVDYVIGVSAGIAYGVSYVSKQPQRNLEILTRFVNDRRYMGLKNLVDKHNRSYFGLEFSYETIPNELVPFDYDTFADFPGHVEAVVTNLDTGNAEYLPIHSVFAEMDVLRASGSMPFFAQPVPWQGRRYLDGGVADSIPYEAMGRLGYDRRVVILTRDLEYRNRPMPRAAVRAMYGKYPVFCQRLLNRHTVYNASVARLAALEKAGEIFVLRPSQPITVHRLERDPAALQAVYDLGVKDARARLAALKDYLSK